MFNLLKLKCKIVLVGIVSLALTASVTPLAANAYNPSNEATRPCHTLLVDIVSGNAAEAQAALDCVSNNTLWVETAFTTSTWHHRADAIAMGTMFLADDPKQAIYFLDTLTYRMEPRGNTTSLAALLSATPDSSAQADYTAASWTPYAALRATASTAAAPNGNVDLNQTQVNAIELDFLRAFAALVPQNPPPTGAAVLASAITAAQAFGQADYTAASWTPFADALASAKAIDPATATADAIQAAASALITAIAGLVQITPTPTDTGTGSPNPSPNPSTDTPKPNPSNSTGGNSTTNPLPTASGSPFVGNPAANAVVKVKAAQQAVTLVKGKKVKIPAYAYTSTGVKGKVTWSSNKSKVAKVSSTGTVTAKKVGKATITVKATNGLKAKIKVRVVSKARKGKPSKVTVKGVAQKLEVGQVTYATSNYKSSTLTGIKVTYKSSAKAIVKVDKAGRIVAVKAGQATLTVKAGKKVKKIKITVR